MITQKDLIKIFQEKAEKNGWSICEGDFPSRIEGDFCPKPENVFKALELIRPSDVNYLIIGQDPYYSLRPDKPEPIATGVAFAVPKDCPEIPPSLRNILKSLLHGDDRNRDLVDWAREKGVLLLNAALTVPLLTKGRKSSDVTGKHLNHWERFTTGVIHQVKETRPDVQIIAWGTDARDVLDDALRQFIWCKHPSRTFKDKLGFESFCASEIGKRLKSKASS